MTPALTVAYDANGNTLSDAQGRSFTWDFENRLAQAVNPGVGITTFKYDPFGKRIQKSGPNGITNYLYDGQWENVIEEVDSNGALVARYTQESGLDFQLSEFRSGVTSYYEQDGVNSVSSLTNQTGTLVNTYTHDSFGRRIASFGTLVNPLQYTGREFDSETGVYQYRARYYDQNLGRFVSEDPIGFAGAKNFYAYVSGDPVDFNDPSGLKRFHGNWCGPNWTGGLTEQYHPEDLDQYLPPIDHVDIPCSHHDICYFRCRLQHPCKARPRRHCMRKCDYRLLHELVTYPKNVFNPWSYIIGLGIAFDVWPPAGQNGGPDIDPSWPGHNSGVDCSCN